MSYSVFDVACCIYDWHYKFFDVEVNEIKLYNLLYFVQRECLGILKKEAFNGKMIAHNEGVYFKGLYDDVIFNEHDYNIERDISHHIVGITERYGEFTGWKLRELIKNESCWNKAMNREDNTIELVDIMEDAKKVREYDYYFGDYCDILDSLYLESIFRDYGDSVIINVPLYSTKMDLCLQDDNGNICTSIENFINGFKYIYKCVDNLCDCDNFDDIISEALDIASNFKDIYNSEYSKYFISLTINNLVPVTIKSGS